MLYLRLAVSQGFCKVVPCAGTPALRTGKRYTEPPFQPLGNVQGPPLCNQRWQMYGGRALSAPSIHPRSSAEMKRFNHAKMHQVENLSATAKLSSDQWFFQDAEVYVAQKKPAPTFQYVVWLEGSQSTDLIPSLRPTEGSHG